MDAHPYIVNALALATAVSEEASPAAAPADAAAVASPAKCAAAAAASAMSGMSELMARCLADDSPASWAPLPPDSPFRALFHGEIRLHQGMSLPQNSVAAKQKQLPQEFCT